MVLNRRTFFFREYITRQRLAGRQETVTHTIRSASCRLNRRESTPPRASSFSRLLFSRTGTLQTPSDAFMKTSGRGLSNCTIFVVVVYSPPLVTENIGSARKTILSGGVISCPGGVISCPGGVLSTTEGCPPPPPHTHHYGKSLRTPAAN